MLFQERPHRPQKGKPKTPQMSAHPQNGLASARAQGPVPGPGPTSTRRTDSHTATLSRQSHTKQTDKVLCKVQVYR